MILYRKAELLGTSERAGVSEKSLKLRFHKINWVVETTMDQIVCEEADLLATERTRVMKLKLIG